MLIYHQKLKKQTVEVLVETLNVKTQNIDFRLVTFKEFIVGIKYGTRHGNTEMQKHCHEQNLPSVNLLSLRNI